MFKYPIYCYFDSVLIYLLSNHFRAFYLLSNHFRVIYLLSNVCHQPPMWLGIQHKMTSFPFLCNFSWSVRNLWIRALKKTSFSTACRHGKESTKMMNFLRLDLSIILRASIRVRIFWNWFWFADVCFGLLISHYPSGNSEKAWKLHRFEQQTTINDNFSEVQFLQ